MILCFLGVHNCHCCILLLCWFILSYGEVLSLQTTTNQELYTIGHFFRGNDLHAPNRDSDSQQPTSPAPQNEDGVRIGLFSKVHTWFHSLYNWALACLRKGCSSVGGSVWGTNVSGEFGGWLRGPKGVHSQVVTCHLTQGFPSRIDRIVIDGVKKSHRAPRYGNM